MNKEQSVYVLFIAKNNRKINFFYKVNIKMSSSTITYEFVFHVNYDEAVFMQSPYASDTLRPKVKTSVQSSKSFLSKFLGVNTVSQKVTDNGLTFKVTLNRT